MYGRRTINGYLEEWLLKKRVPARFAYDLIRVNNDDVGHVWSRGMAKHVYPAKAPLT